MGGQQSSASWHSGFPEANGVQGKSHMREVIAEDENLVYRRSVSLISDDARLEIDRKVTERMRFCCEEKWKDYLRCMEGRTLSKNPECVAIREVADVCVEQLSRKQITANTKKKHVMGLLQGEARLRTAISVPEWRQRHDIPDPDEISTAAPPPASERTAATS
ncbi:hypothetical protein DIPPA_04955 [Diplonema papillatum]|nr:hypothetical protein DIPPA_04955 [Diplonema papillatum]